MDTNTESGHEGRRGAGAEWLTLREAAEAVEISTKTIRRAVLSGRLLGQKAETVNAPWLVRAADVQELWGRGRSVVADPPREAPTLAPQLETFAKLLAEAKSAEAEARERAARAEAEADHLRERLAEMRTEPTRRERRRWWKTREPKT